MAKKPTYEDLEQRVKELEKVAAKGEASKTAFQYPEQEQEAILNSLVEHVVYQDTEMRILWANRAACESVNMKREELVGRYCYEVWSQRSDPCPECPVITVMETRRPEGIEKNTPDGRTWFVRGYPLQDDNGIIVGAIEVALETTEHKHAKIALRESEERFRETVELLPSIVCEYDTEGRFTYVNTYGLETFGFTQDDLKQGIYATQIFPPEEVDKFKDRLGAILKGEKPASIEYRLQCKDGSTIYVIANSAPIYKDGKIIGARSSVTPITERRQIEETLRKSEKRYRLLSDNVTDVIWTMDLNLRLTYISPSVTKQQGYTVEEAMERTLEESCTADSLERIRKLFAEEMEIEKNEQKDMSRSRAIEVEIKRKDGSTLWTEGKVSFLRDRYGKPNGIIGVTRNITKRRQAEKALRESEEKYRTVLEASPDPIVVYDMKGKVIYFNPAFTRVFGWTLEERLGKKMDLFVPEKAWPETKIMIEKVLAGERFSGVETLRYTQKGKIIPVSVSGAIYKDQHGNPMGSVINLRDISEDKKLENQLQQAQKMEAIGTLAGGIAHDFNNLLMGIQGRTSLMLMDADGPEPHFEHLKGIEGYVKSAVDLTKQLLGFARSGKYEVKTVDLSEIIKNQNHMFGRTRKEINIQEKYDKNLWTVEADKGQIEQVLLNIYVNAWQAMPGGGDLYIQTENVSVDDNTIQLPEAVPGKYVKISITDTGVGMDEATRQRIFDPFFTTKEMGRGTGLGLASVYGIIKNHGGFINVYSEKGEGTTFNIYLPASEKEAVREKELSGETLKGTETLLLVDDEEIIIEVGQRIFEQLGYKVMTAKSGKAAIEIYEKNPDKIDMVVLDMIMPEMGGGKTYDRLKEINPDIKILLSSGYSINGQATEILERGCNGFIQKPFNIPDLSKKIREILDKGQ